MAGITDVLTGEALSGAYAIPDTRKQGMIDKKESEMYRADESEKPALALGYLMLIGKFGTGFDYTMAGEAIEAVQSSVELKSRLNGDLEKTVNRAREVLRCRLDIGG